MYWHPEIVNRGRVTGRAWVVPDCPTGVPDPLGHLRAKLTFGSGRVEGRGWSRSTQLGERKRFHMVPAPAGPGGSEEEGGK